MATTENSTVNNTSNLITNKPIVNMEIDNSLQLAGDNNPMASAIDYNLDRFSDKFKGVPI